MRKHMSTIIAVLIFITGLSLLLYPTVSNYFNSLHQSKVVANYSDKMKKMEEREKRLEEESSHLKAELESAWVDLEPTRADLESTNNDLESAHSKLRVLRSKLESVHDDKEVAKWIIETQESQIWKKRHEASHLRKEHDDYV